MGEPRLDICHPFGGALDVLAAIIASDPEIDLVLRVLALGGVVGRRLGVVLAGEISLRGKQVLRFRPDYDARRGAPAGAGCHTAQQDQQDPEHLGHG